MWYMIIVVVIIVMATSYNNNNHDNNQSEALFTVEALSWGCQEGQQLPANLNNTTTMIWSESIHVTNC